MAYVSKEKKAKIAAALKVALKDSGVKYTLAVHHHSSIVLNIRSGKIDFIKNFNNVVTSAEYKHFNPRAEGATDYISVNPYHFEKHFTGKALKVLQKAIKCLNTDNHDNSDIQTDYFDVGHYVDINIGRWDKPYVVTK